MENERNHDGPADRRLIGAAVRARAGRLVLAVRPGALDDVLEAGWSASPRCSSSSTCCGRCSVRRTSDRCPSATCSRSDDRACASSSSPRSSGRYIYRVMEGERDFPEPVLHPVERPSTASPASTRRRAGLEGLRRLRPRDGGRRDRRRLHRAAPPGRPAAQPGRHPAESPDLAFNTSVSFETNTNWQNYSGETGVTYLSQTAMLAVRNFTSAATGLAVAIALIRGLTRRSRKTLGNYWVDLTRASCTSCCRSRSSAPSSWSGRACRRPRTRPDRDHAPGRAADDRHRPDRVPGVDQGARQQRWRVLQRQLRPPLREPDAPDELARDLRPPRDLVRADLHVRPIRRQPAPGLDDLRAMAADPAGRRRRARCTPSPPATRSSRPASTRRLGNMEGKEIRFGAAVGGLFMAATTGTSTGAINAWHDSFQPHRRAGPAVQHGARRDHAGWHRRRYVRDARHRRDPRGVHRRADGRPDARVPRQEGRGVRDQDGDADGARARRQHPRLHGHRIGPARRPRRSAEPGPARLLRDPVRLLEPDRQQRLGVRGPGRQHAVLQRRRRRRDADRALRDDRPDPRAGGLDGRQAPRRAVARDVPHHRACCSPCCSSAS